MEELEKVQYITTHLSFKNIIETFEILAIYRRCS